MPVKRILLTELCFLLREMDYGVAMAVAQSANSAPKKSASKVGDARVVVSRKEKLGMIL